MIYKMILVDLGQKRMQNTVKIYDKIFCENSYRFLSVNYFHKKLHHRSMTGF